MAKSMDTSGHTLIEVVVVVGILALVAAMPVIGLAEGVGLARSRSVADLWRGVACSAQLRSHWLGEDTAVTADTDNFTLQAKGGDSAAGALLLVEAGTVTRANVGRWTVPEGVVVGFVGPFAAPDSGGSIYFDRWARVVIRPESGFASRRAP